MIKQSIQMGVMPSSPCSYLPDQNESMAVVLEMEVLSNEGYQALLQAGFRRSGNNIYRPHCEQCHACQSIRVSVPHFKPSTSQKRLIAKLKQLTVERSTDLDPGWFDLYQRYIEKRHRNGSMFPANKDDFLSFVESDWMQTEYLHFYQDGRLIAVAVTDMTQNGYSAIYSFFEPEHKWSLGTLCVLAQIDVARRDGIRWLYLGYQIDQCQAMNYKTRFSPHQRYNAGRWL